MADHTRPTIDTSTGSERNGRAKSTSMDDNFNMLLTPPPVANPINPLEMLTFASPPSLAHTDDENQYTFQHNARHRGTLSSSSAHDPSGLLHGLSIRTDFNQPRRSGSMHSIESEGRLRSSASQSSLPRRAPSIRNLLHSTAGSISPGSVISSPQLNALLDVTPLPSPTLGAFESWKTISKTRSRGSSTSSRTTELPPALFPVTSFSLSSPKKKIYPGLSQITNVHPAPADAPHLTEDTRERTRSLSEYVPEALAISKPRNIAVSTSGPPPDLPTPQSALQREEYLGVQRGIAVGSPPSSSAARPDTRDDDEPAPKRQKVEVFTAGSINTGQIRRYESIRQLGQGTFSKVLLAVRQVHDCEDTVDYSQDSTNMDGVRARSRRLVAIKVVSQGPAGGADAERIAISLKREVELLKVVKHPSVVHLKAFGNDSEARALLVMNYCPGGDLFDVASTKLEILTPSLVRRIFAELVSAVRYLHQKFIVHRDIKLENVLLNIPLAVHQDVPNWQTIDRAVVTLTDLGLSRKIPEPPESPLLTTRCGSEDYAAPEILMGQPYDGRQTDAWAMGVLLYSLMEGRLPFDPLPGARGDSAILRARKPHRIARCEWAWVRYGDEDGEWDPEKGKALMGAQVCVDGLLKRCTRRKPLTEIREMAWVTDGIKVDGGLRWVEEEVYG